MATKQVYKCNRCGTFFPDDYYDNWGRKYGIGLGPTPVCEALDSKYDVPPIASVMDPSTFMHPVGVCRGNVIAADVDEATPTATLAIDDPYMIKRAAIMKEKQISKSNVMKFHHEKLATI